MLTFLWLPAFGQTAATTESDSCPLDTLYNVMRLDFDHGDYLSCARRGYNLLDVHDSILAEYPGTFHLYYMLTNSLLYLRKEGDVPRLAERGIHFTNKMYSDKNDEHYGLHLTRISAYLMMGKIDDAKAELSVVDEMYKQSGVELPNVKSALEALSKEVAKAGSENWADRKAERKKQIERLNGGILLSSQTSEDGVRGWHQYFSLFRETLEYFNFNTSDAQDEDYWNWFLANMMTYFFVCCDNLPDRECLAYDNILLRKNFLNYHSGKLHKQPQSWFDIASALDEKEVAIEITELPDEILILKKGAKPVSVPIDSVLHETLTRTNLQDPLAINELYSQDGPLSVLWKTVEPYLQGISIIYLSSANVFSQFNYGAIPLGESHCVADKYDFNYVVSTLDIEYLKTHSSCNQIKDVVLYGGVTYETAKYSLLKESPASHQENEWGLTRNLDDATRGSYKDLPGSLLEVCAIDSVCQAYGIRTNLITANDATEESLKEFSGKNIDVLHISTHGFMLASLFNSENHEYFRNIVGNKYQTILSQSGLLMAGANHVWQGGSVGDGREDGILTSKELSELDFSRVKLAVLSACDTGLGDVTNLTGASYGVHYALKEAGVENILACLWKVNDMATSLFMQLFYNNLLKGKSCQDAVRQTQRDMQQCGYEDPYYWAAFVLVR